MLVELLASDKECILQVVGESSDSEVKDFVTSNKQVKYSGRVENRRSLEIMAKSDLVALLYDPQYRFNVDAAPNKMYEALMVGRPIVAPIGTPMADIIDRYDCGYKIPFGDAEALRKVVAGVRSQPEIWIKKARNARKCYEENFRWSDEKEFVTQMYRELLE